MNTPLPCKGHRVPADTKKFKEVVVFVPNFGGDQRFARRHQEWVAQLGFDSVRFELSYNNFKDSWRLPVTSQFQMGVRHVWSEEIHRVLNALPENKIVFSFSAPSAAAVAAMAERNVFDVQGWVADSGPFLELWRCSWNYFSCVTPIRNPLVKMPMVVLSYNLLGGKKLATELHQHMATLPSGFRVFSVRGWQDRLVPISAIEKAFNRHDHLDLEVLSLPEAGHLEGLSQCPEEYKTRVGSFLKQVATPLPAPHPQQESWT